MRGISEERLIELRDGGSSPNFHRTIKVLTHNECTELNPWRPIETAPKDSTKLLLFIPGYGQWVGDSGTTVRCAKGDLTATHWQELPPDPEGAEK